MPSIFPKLWIAALGLCIAEAACLDSECAKGRDDEELNALLQFGPIKPITPEPTPAPTAEPTPAPTPEPSPAPTPEPCPGGPSLVFGTPLAGYHNVTVWVYYWAMKQLNPNTGIQMVVYPHAILYPMFLGPVAGDADGLCSEPGCADKCADAQLGSISPCVDFVVDSNIPVNHASFGLRDHQDQYDVIGTAFETQYIGIFAPKYTGWKSIDDAARDAKRSSWPREILGWQSGDGDNCDTLYCPKCGSGDVPIVTDPPLGYKPIGYNNGVGANFTYSSFPCPQFEREVARRLRKKEKFLTFQWYPQAMLARFPELVFLNPGIYKNSFLPNQAKAQIRKDRRYKFTTKQLSVLGAIFLGSDDVEKMDGWQHGIGLPKGHGKVYGHGKGHGKGYHRRQLCDEGDGWNTGCAAEAAQLWIHLNSNISQGPILGVKQGVWETFFW